jgi:hypothetical protein
MNPTGVPSPERPRDHASPPDGTALRSGNGIGAVWHANPKGASPRLGTLGLHDGTALRFNATGIAGLRNPREPRQGSAPLGCMTGPRCGPMRNGVCEPHVPGEDAAPPLLGCMTEPRCGSMADGRRKPAWRDRVAFQSASACINVIGAVLTFLDPLDR